MRARDWRRLPDGKSKGRRGGRSPLGFPEWAKGCCGQAGRGHSTHKGGWRGWARSTHRVQGEAGPAHGALWAEYEMVEKLPWARGGQTGWGLSCP